MMKKILSVVVLIVVAFFNSQSAHAGFLVDFNFSGAGSVDFINANIAGVNTDNDSTASLGGVLEGSTSFNWIAFRKDFDSVNPIDITFDVLNSQGTTEYYIVEVISNTSGQSWTDYHLQLGVGAGEGFIPLGSIGADGLGLDFDTPDGDPSPIFTYLFSGPVFAGLDQSADALNWYDGLLAQNAPDADISSLAFLAYSLDVPDAGNEDRYTFTLRQFPTTAPVPEPSSLLLLGSGVFGAFSMRKRRKV